MAATLAGFGVAVRARGGKDPLPAPVAAGVPVLAAPRGWKFHPAGSLRDVHAMHAGDAIEMATQRFAHRLGQDRRPVAVALAGTHDQLATVEVDVLHTELRAFEQTEARTVQQHGHEL